LPSLARRVMRAASVFGETFWRGGVSAVLGQQVADLDVEQGLGDLIAAELIEKHPESRLAGEEEYGFRHALARDAAYGLLLAEDLRTSHCQAGSYLILAGETDPLPIAEHLDRGGVPTEALRFYTQASELGLRRGDFTGALELSMRADRCGPQGELLGHLRAIQASIYSFTLDREAQARAGQEALRLLPPGSQRWSRAGQSLIAAESARGNMQVIRELVHRMLDVIPEPDALSDYQWMIAQALWALCNTSDFTLARQLFEYAHALQQAFPASWVPDRMMLAQSQYLRFVEPNPWQQVQWLLTALEHSERAETIEFMILIADFLGEAQGELGDFSAGEATLRKSLERARQAKLEYQTIHAQLHLAELLIASPTRAHSEEAAEITRAVLSVTKLSVGLKEWAHGLLARALLNLGEPVAADGELRNALALTALSPLRRLLIEATRLECLLALGRAAEAEQQLAQSLPKLEALGSAGYAEIPVRLAAAETLTAVGNRDGAARQLERAWREIERRAQGIPDTSARERFLTQITEHARVKRALEHAR
jgi:tetratricopeptide (TPR) repeat protein